MIQWLFLKDKQIDAISLQTRLCFQLETQNGREHSPTAHWLLQSLSSHSQAADLALSDKAVQRRANHNPSLTVPLDAESPPCSTPLISRATIELGNKYLKSLFVNDMFYE